MHQLELIDLERTPIWVMENNMILGFILERIKRVNEFKGHIFEF